MIAEARVSTIKKMSFPQRHELGLRVLIMRTWPRGVSRSDVNVWLPDAGPSKALLQVYRDGSLSWSEFEKCYRAEQSAQSTCRIVRYEHGTKISDKVVRLSPMNVLRELEREHGKISVMCWEDSECCHRHILVEDLSKVEVVL